MERGEMGPVLLPYCPKSPLGDCCVPWVPPCPLSPGSPVAPVKWTERTGKDNVTLEEGCCCLSAPAQTPCWLSALGTGLAGISPPKSHPPQGGDRDTCACFIPVSGQGGSFSLTLPSLIQQHKNPSAATCPVPPAQGTKNSPSVCPLPSETVPAVLGLLFVKGCPCHCAACTQMPAGAAGAQHPSGCPGHPNSLCRCWVWVTEGSTATVAPRVRVPSPVSLSS